MRAKLIALPALACGLAAAAFFLAGPRSAGLTPLRDAPNTSAAGQLQLDKAASLSIPKASTPPQDQSMVKWKLTFQDDFNGPGAPGVPADCYTRTPQCVITGWGGAHPCPEYAAALKNLNKCVWRAWDFYNYMDFDAPKGKGVNYFNPSEVLVENGRLVLRASRSAYARGDFDCKNPMTDPVFGTQDNTKACPFVSGGIDSKPDNGYPGFDQLYGRFEVYGKLSKGGGTWPAFWMTPTKAGEQGGWPYSGEIDIMESWSDGPNNASGALHEGVQGGERFDKSFHFKSKTLASEFHLYAVEWDPGKVTFMVDNKVTGSVYRSESEIPSLPFFWMLNLTIEPAEKRGKVKPDPDNFPEQRLEVDYVKTYRKCTEKDNPSECVKIDVAGVVEQYNTYHNETAFSQINVYPSPQRKGQPMTVRVTSKQYCEKFKVEAYDLNGRLVRQLYDGPFDREETKYFEMDTNDMAAALYLLTGYYEKCEGGGKGNHAFKFVVVN